MGKKSPPASFWPKASAVSLAFGANLFLMFLKAVASLQTGSQALMTDAIHSLGDVLVTATVGVASFFGESPADEDHPFGHGALESLAGLGVGLLLLLASLERISEALQGLTAPAGIHAGPLGLGVLLVVVVVKEALHRQARQEADQTGSPSARALARDHRSDVLASLAAAVGVGFASLGHPQFDPLASLVIAAFVLQFSWETITENVDLLMGRQPEDSVLLDRLRQRAEATLPKVHFGEIHALPVGRRFHLRIEVEVDSSTSVGVWQTWSNRIQEALREEEPRVDQVWFDLGELSPSMAPAESKPSESEAKVTPDGKNE